MSEKMAGMNMSGGIWARRTERETDMFPAWVYVMLGSILIYRLVFFDWIDHVWMWLF